MTQEEFSTETQQNTEKKKSENQLRVLGASVVKTTTRTIPVLALPPSPLYT
jgi:hypothetical protein